LRRSRGSRSVDVRTSRPVARERLDLSKRIVSGVDRTGRRRYRRKHVERRARRRHRVGRLPCGRGRRGCRVHRLEPGDKRRLLSKARHLDRTAARRRRRGSPTRGGQRCSGHGARAEHPNRVVTWSGLVTHRFKPWYKACRHGHDGRRSRYRQYLRCRRCRDRSNDLGLVDLNGFRHKATARDDRLSGFGPRACGRLHGSRGVDAVERNWSCGRPRQRRVGGRGRGRRGRKVHWRGGIALTRREERAEHRRASGCFRPAGADFRHL
jgi:hypothetical protein